jgi:hypothetical protein
VEQGARDAKRGLRTSPWRPVVDILEHVVEHDHDRDAEHVAVADRDHDHDHDGWCDQERFPGAPRNSVRVFERLY